MLLQASTQKSDFELNSVVPSGQKHPSMKVGGLSLGQSGSIYLSLYLNVEIIDGKKSHMYAYV